MRARLAGFTAVAVMALLCMTGVALAKSVKATAPIQKGNEFCDFNDEAAPVLGTVKLKRTGNEVTVKWKITAAEPNAEYYPAMFSAETCVEDGAFFAVTTNKKGKAKATATYVVGAGEKVFQVAFTKASPFGFNLTPPVTLPMP